MRRLASALMLAALSSSSAAEWVIVNDNDEYIAYAEPASISRDGNMVRMRDLIDFKYPQSSPYGNQHASSKANSEFDCGNPRIRTIAFSLHSGRMGDGDVIETSAESNLWLPVMPGTLLGILWQFACAKA